MIVRICISICNELFYNVYFLERKWTKASFKWQSADFVPPGSIEEMLSQPPYSPHCTKDYYLFRYLQSILNDCNFNDAIGIKIALASLWFLLW